MDLYANNLIEFDAEKTKQLAEKYRDALAILGENPDREGLLKTPERVAKAMATAQSTGIRKIGFVTEPEK